MSSYDELAVCLHLSYFFYFPGRRKVISSASRTWFPPMLKKRISKILLRQCKLILVGEVEIIKAEYKRLYVVFGEGLGKGCDEGCFAYALDAI